MNTASPIIYPAQAIITGTISEDVPNICGVTLTITEENHKLLQSLSYVGKQYARNPYEIGKTYSLQEIVHKIFHYFMEWNMMHIDYLYITACLVEDVKNNKINTSTETYCEIIAPNIENITAENIGAVIFSDKGLADFIEASSTIMHEMYNVLGHYVAFGANHTEGI